MKVMTENEIFTPYDEVIEKLRFRRDYHFDSVVPFRKDIEAKHWYAWVAFLDVYNTFHD